MNNTKVLIIDDDTNILRLIQMYLDNENIESFTAPNGRIGLEVFEKEEPDIVILDIMMPEIGGWDVCKEIRKKSSIPVIMLSARGETFDKVMGLELGADDYMVKPFDPKELLARIKAVLRRTNTVKEEEDQLFFKDLAINKTTYIVNCGDETLELPPKEMELLYFLASHPNKVFTRDQLLEHVWEYDFMGDSRTVDVHVKRIREKLGDSENWQLKTVWGVGYKFEVK